MKLIFAIVIFATFLASCGQSGQNKGYDPNVMSHQVTIDEVLQATSYTYLKVSENESQYWIAVTKMEAQPGDKFTFSTAMEMKDFKSTDLNRVFESVVFVEDLAPDSQQSHNMNSNGHNGKVTDGFYGNIHIDPKDGSITIAQLYQNRASYSGKTVKVYGQVVKVNNDIMGRNWIHLQDGTRNGDDYDLTVTSQQTAEPGATVMVEGSITLDKDFGHGYAYSILMENTAISK